MNRISERACVSGESERARLESDPQLLAHGIRLGPGVLRALRAGEFGLARFLHEFLRGSGVEVNLPVRADPELVSGRFGEGSRRAHRVLFP